VNAGRTPDIVSAGYTYNKRDDKLTTNFALDRAPGTLVMQGSHEGACSRWCRPTPGADDHRALGLGPLADASFDIADVSNAAFAALRLGTPARRGCTASTWPPAAPHDRHGRRRRSAARAGLRALTMAPRGLALLPALALGTAGVAQPRPPRSTSRCWARTARPLAEAVVFLESRVARAACRPLTGIEIEQADKRFTQRVTVVTVGSAVSFPNRDKVRHHVYSFSPAKTFELKLYIGTPANPVVFDRPASRCWAATSTTPWLAWVVVVETPTTA
jgi:hypothetical protein